MDEVEAEHKELLALLRVAVAALLVEVVLEDEVWATMLGSVEGMGFPSLVWSFTTWREYQNVKILTQLIETH